MYGLWEFGERDWTWIDMPPNPNKELPVGGAAVIQLGADEFLVAGSDVRFDSRSTSPLERRERRSSSTSRRARSTGGQWLMKRRWNGDQLDYGLNLVGAGAAQGSAGDLSMKLEAIACALASVGTTAIGQVVERTPTGIIVHPKQGPAVRLEVYPDGIIRVTEAPTGTADRPSSFMVRAKPLANAYTLDEKRLSPITRLNSGKSTVEVDGRTGAISFRDPGGKVVLTSSDPPNFTRTSAEGLPSLAISQQFNRGTDEGFYGLGQHQNGQMNYNGEDVLLLQHNMDVAIPFVVSTRNYGLLWDNNSVTRFGEPKPYTYAGAADDGLQVNGGRGWTATYSVNGKTIERRSEPTIQLQYLEEVNRWPQGTRTADMQQTVPGLHVTWQGTIISSSGGLHRFRLYGSSYFKLFVDGREVLNRWRQNWNPFYHNFDVEFAAGKPHNIRIEWDPDFGLHRAPSRQSESGRGSPFADFVFRFRVRRRLLLHSRQQHG